MTPMNIPFNDLLRQYGEMRHTLDMAFGRVAASGWYILGSEVKHFEESFAAFCGSEYCIGVANGTDALELALRAAGCEAGDEVVTTANAGFYTSTACILTGAIPVYVDVNAETLTMCPKSLTTAIGPKTKAVVVTHLYGMLADMPAIIDAVRGKSILVIEDCAQAHGAALSGRRAGTYGDIGTFSFYPTKNLGALGDGGAVITSNDMLALKLRQLRQYGWSAKYNVEIPYGRNSRLDEFQAAILSAKLPRLDAWNARRRDIIAQYRAAVSGDVLKFVATNDESFVGHLCVVRHPSREEFRHRLQKKGIETAVHFPILDNVQLAMRNVHWRAVGLPASERAISEIISLPCFPEMRDDEVRYVCGAIRECA